MNVDWFCSSVYNIHVATAKFYTKFQKSGMGLSFTVHYSYIGGIERKGAVQLRAVTLRYICPYLKAYLPYY